jgi:hypothetical protein
VNKNLVVLIIVCILYGCLVIHSKAQSNCIPLEEAGLIKYKINELCGANRFYNFSLIPPLENNKKNNLLIIDEINKIISKSSYRRELLSDEYNLLSEKAQDSLKNMKFKINWKMLERNVEISLNDSFCLESDLSNEIFYYSNCLFSSRLTETRTGDFDKTYFLNIDLNNQKILDFKKDILNIDSIESFQLWVKKFCKKNKINTVPVAADEPLFDFKHKIEYLNGLKNYFYFLKDSLVVFNKVKILDIEQDPSFNSGELQNGNEYYMEVSIPKNLIKSFLSKNFIDKFYTQ